MALMLDSQVGLPKEPRLYPWFIPGSLITMSSLVPLVTPERLGFRVWVDRAWLTQGLWLRNFEITFAVRLEVLAAQSCLTLCKPMDCGPAGSSVHGILQARILEWVAIFSWMTEILSS